MSFIRYSEKRDKWDPNSLNAYDEYFKSKLNLLQTLERQKQLENFAKSKKFTTTINNSDFTIDEDFLAEIASKKLSAAGADKEIAKLYTEVVDVCSSAGKEFGTAFTESSQALLQIREDLIPSGTKFSVDSGGALDLEKAALEASRIKRGGISNVLGNVGEGVSSLAGAAIVNSLVEEMEKQLGSQNNIKVKATYKNVGDVHYADNYRSQTDNLLTIEFNIKSKTSGEVGNLILNYNISDKANKKLAEMSERKKSTGRLKIRNSTVGAQSKDLDNEGLDALYNVISYHYGFGGGGVQNYSSALRYSGMHSNAGTSLRAYIGYKMLLDTLIKSKDYNDEINFTVYGGRIIPEPSVVQKLLDTTKGGNFRYLAEIRYYQLLKKSGGDYISAVKNSDEAESVIKKMPTGIGESFDISLDK